MQVYCPNCGHHELFVFRANQFVLVKPRGRPPYYGRILRTSSGDEGPRAMIDKGMNEKEWVELNSLSPVED